MRAGTVVADSAVIGDLQAQIISLERQNADLEAAHNRYLDLYDLSPAGYVTLSQDDQIAEINLTAANLFGLEREALVGRRLSSLLIPEDFDRWQLFFSNQLRHGGNQNGEFTLAIQAGEPVSVRLDCLCVRRDNMGLAIHVALTDISERKRSAAAILESEARYHSVFNNARNGLVIADAESRCLVEANEAFLRMIGCRRDQLSQLKIADILPDPGLPRAVAAFEELAAGATAVAEDISIRRLDGNILDVDINGGPFIQDGKRRILGEFHDISARKRAEESLREQAAFFRLITENLDGFVAVLDINGRRLYNSPSYVQFFGERISSGSDSFADIHPSDRARVKQAFLDTVRTGVGQHLEYRLMMFDGGVRVIESRGGVIRGDDGRVQRVIVVSNDITERRKSEEKILQLAFYDALTQLPNRLALSDRLQQAMAASKRSGRYGALMFLDLDEFKPLNDSHGHQFGDRLLVEVGERLFRCIREIDTVARIGGDEFVIVLTELDADYTQSMLAAERVAEKIRSAIAEPYIVEVSADDGVPLKIIHRCTASIGVVLFWGNERNEKELLNMADAEMYLAKQEGRNRVRLKH